MIGGIALARGIVVALCVSVARSAFAQQTPAAPAPPAAPASAPADSVPPAIEPKAIEILKASSARLAAARTMSFRAVVSYESPSRLGPPLVYTTRSEVTFQPPDKLRVITPADGPASDFFDDGKTMMAFSPAANLVAVTDALPTVDAALKKAFDMAAIYFPFADFVVKDPYKDITEGMVNAFYIGRLNQKPFAIGLAGILITGPTHIGPAAAWSHADRWGGSVSHAPGSGSTTRTSAWGGSETHTYGQGTTATGRYGDTATHAQGSGSTSFTNPYAGSATHTYGQGTTATSAYGGTATHTYGSGQTTFTNQYGGSAMHYYGAGTTYTSASGATAYHNPYYGGYYGAYHPPYPAPYHPYHPPTTVNYYGSGCYDCGGWSTAGAAAAGAAAGVVTGAAIASSASAAQTSSAYSAGVAAGSANTAAATTSAYNAGVAAGSATTVPPAPVPAAGSAFMMGGIYPTLPAGRVSPKAQGSTYYLCGNTWFQPFYGANGVSYRVVPGP